VDSSYLQALRYRLQKRFRPINSVDGTLLHSTLQQFMSYIGSVELYRAILAELIEQEPDSAAAADEIFSDRVGVVFDEERAYAATCYQVLVRCAASSDDSIEIQVAAGAYEKPKRSDAIEFFKENFVEPVYEYLDEALDAAKSVLGLLLKLKHRSEWFRRAELFSLWSGKTASGERRLAAAMYEYLFDQGLDFQIEPSSASGEADLIGAQGETNRLVADAKVFNPSHSLGKRHIEDGVRQVYDYCCDYNEPVGYLVVFLTGPEALRLELTGESAGVSYFSHNGKTIFVLTIDIFEHDETASKRGPLTAVRITLEDLLKRVSDSDSPGPAPQGET
jgi:hypothetical protein